MPKRNTISYAQAQLAFSGTDRRAVRQPFEREWRVVYVAGACLLAVSLVYGYAVVSSIAEVSLRESARKEVRTLTALRGTLESEYLAKTNGITETYARTLGYRDPVSRVFYERPTALSYETHAR